MLGEFESIKTFIKSAPTANLFAGRATTADKVRPWARSLWVATAMPRVKMA